MDDIIRKIKKIKESRLTPTQKVFIDFLNKMTHRPDFDIKQKEEWFIGYNNHIFTHDKRTNKITVYTHDYKWKEFRLKIGILLIDDKINVDKFLENEIKNYFGCNEVEFFYNSYIENQRKELYEKWTESYNEVLNR